jgi:hypothetical protein
MEAMFSVRSGPRLYNEEQLPLQFSCETVESDSLKETVCEFGPGANSWKKYQLKPAVRG